MRRYECCRWKVSVRKSEKGLACRRERRRAVEAVCGTGGLDGKGASGSTGEESGEVAVDAEAVDANMSSSGRRWLGSSGCGLAPAAAVHIPLPREGGDARAGARESRPNRPEGDGCSQRAAARVEVFMAATRASPVQWGSLIAVSRRAPHPRPKAGGSSVWSGWYVVQDQTLIRRCDCRHPPEDAHRVCVTSCPRWCGRPRVRGRGVDEAEAWTW